MFNFLCGEVDSSHYLGQLCTYKSDQYWLVVQHHNDFMYVINDETRYGKGGEVLIVPPGNKIIHGSPRDTDIPYIDDWIITSGDDLDSLINELRLPVNISFDLSDSKFISQYIIRIQNELDIPRIGRHCIASNIIGEMLVEMGRQYDNELNIRSPQKLRLERVRKEMLSSYNREWSLKSLSDMAGYSQSYFSALYIKYYGISPIEELLAYRIDVAKDLLTRNNKTITDISTKCGFASIHHFSRYFKKYVGVSPSAYSKQMPKNIAE